MATVSLTSVESGKSNRSRHRNPPKIISRTSYVDETLFGPPARLKQMTGNRSWGGSSDPDLSPSLGGGSSQIVGGSKKRAGGRGRRMSNDPEVVQVITKDLIRKIRVPGTPDPSGLSVVLDQAEFERIRQGAKVLTDLDKRELEVTARAGRNARLEASNARKMEMQALEMQRKKNEKPSDLEQEAQEKGTELLGKAKAMMDEQDDEIKKLNEVILNAKCHAIRDTQLKEKEEIEKSMREEEERLDLMMEVDRVKALAEFEEREKERHLQRLKGAEVIQHQIKGREQQRLLDAEKKDQETQAMLKYLERLQEEDMENLQKKRQSQKQLMEEVAQCNEEIQRQKALHKEQEKLEDLRVMEYLQEKEKREEEHQAELERQKAEKEKEISRLRAQQERAKDKQAERDALRAKRRHEEFEREWRRKERDEAIKKAETEKMLIDARHQQIQHRDHFLAVEALRDREEFNRVLKVQKELMDQDKKKQEADAARRHAHAEEVRKQVREKEAGKVMQRRAFFDEGIKLDQEARERRKKLDEIKQRKLAELKAVGIPDKYCAEVSRRITAPPPSFTMSGLH